MAIDIHQQITDQIIEMIERGTQPWRPRWDNAAMSLPLRHTGETYRGINILILWAAQLEHGYTSPTWMTYRQARELGAHVRKGESGTKIIFYKPIHPDEHSDEDERRFVLRTYTVFNREQIEGLPASAPVSGPTSVIHHEAIEAFIRATGAEIRYGGCQACYDPGRDLILMPTLEQFHDTRLAYATTFHELAHWTGAGHRLDRLTSTPFGSEAYAFEELVAELAAAFLGAHYCIVANHLEDHATYLDSWLKHLKSDNRYIFRAAAAAQEACNYLLTLATPQAAAA